MARIRSLKPELWMSPQVMNLSRDARLLFIGLITQADDEGRGTADPRRIKASIFGGDDITSKDVAEWLRELVNQRLVVEYSTNGHGALYELPTWSAHQKIDRPKPSTYPAPTEQSTIDLRLVDDDSPNARRAIDDESRSPRGDRIGSDGSEGSLGSDRTGSTTAAARPTANGHDDQIEFETFKSLYPKRNGNQPWGRARKAINARLAQGHTWQQIQDGARRYAEWCRVTGKLNTETVMQAATFCGPDDEPPFLKPWTLPAGKADTRLASNLGAAAQAKRRLFGGAS